jgi:hypothetical protein
MSSQTNTPRTPDAARSLMLWRMAAFVGIVKLNL